MKIVEKLRKWFIYEARGVQDEPLAEAEDPFATPVIWEITDTIDLHSIAPREIPQVVVAYLDEAYERGFKQVRIIHGKGIGVQRKTVRQILAKTKFVLEFHDAPDASGWGATIAMLREKSNAVTEGNRL